MSTDSLFKKVVNNFPLVYSMLLFEESNCSRIVGWRNRHIYICELPKALKAGPVTEETPNCIIEELVCTSEVISILQHGNSLKVLDNQAGLHILREEPIEDADCDDIFEETSNKVVKWEIKCIKKIIDSCKVLSCCTIQNKIALLIQIENVIHLKIICLDTLSITKEAIIHDYGDFYRDHKGTDIIFVANDNLPMDFVKHWFLIDADCSEGALMIALPDTIVCGILLNESPPKPYFFFSWPFSVVQMKWLNTFEEEDDGFNLGRNLLIIFQGGSIVALGAYGKKVLHYPLIEIKNVLVSNNKLFITDFNDCYSSKISNQSEGVLVPIKGAIGFCLIQNSNEILVATKHRALYNLNSETIVTKRKVHLPPTSLLDNLIRGSNYLEELAQNIQECDNYINAISYAINEQHFIFSFGVQVIGGNCHTLRVFVETETPGVRFKSNIWHLALSISSSDINVSIVKELSSDLLMKSPLEEFYNINIEGNDRFFEIKATFLSFIGDGRYRPSVFIGKVHLDIGYFLQPASSLKHYKLHATKNINLFEILRADTDLEEDHPQEKQIRKNKFSCTIHIPIHSSQNILMEFVKNAKALWRNSEWNLVVNNNKLDLLVGGQLVNLELKEKLINISSSNIEYFYQIKLTLIHLLYPYFRIIANENLLMDIENMLKSLEILQFSKAQDVPSFLQIHQKRKKEIIDMVFSVEAVSN